MTLMEARSRCFCSTNIRYGIVVSGCFVKPGDPLVDSSSVRERLRSLPDFSRALRRVAGLRSKAIVVLLLADYAFFGERGRPTADQAVPVFVKSVGQRVWLRRRSTDLRALNFLHSGHHLVLDLPRPVRNIAVFGSHIGLLLADLAARYPEARLLGVEADPGNAALARRNLARLGDRCMLREAAVWHSQEALAFSWVPDAWGLNVADAGQRATDSATIAAVSARQLLAEFAADEPVDYLLINVGSPWYQLLRHGEWTKNVRCINIEIQNHYDEVVPMLTVLEYEASLRRLSWGAFAVGTR